MMARALAILWLAVVVALAAYLGVVAARGIPLESDLMSLLPAEDRDPLVHRAKDHMAEQVSGRVLILAGHADPAQARRAAGALRDSLVADGLLADVGDVPDAQAVRALGAAYYPHRAGLLAPADREALLAGDSASLAQRTLSQVYGVGGMADARLLANDPFLLLPGFIAALPVPASRLTMVDGWPSVSDGTTTWVLVSGRLRGQAYGLADQQAFAAGYDKAARLAAEAAPGLRLLRLGAVFYARAGAASAMAETSAFGTASTVGTVALVLLAFRSLSPLVLSLLAGGIGLMAAVSATLLLFGSLHTSTAVFGATLMGVTVDYSLHYFSRIFARHADRAERLRHIGMGVGLGLLTTAIGYGVLALAPLPGLRQVAVFSVLGLVASSLTVVLWFPLLDRAGERPLPRLLGWLGVGFWSLWDNRRLAPARRVLLLLLLVGALWGAWHLRVEDDVRRQQALDPALAAEQAEIQRLMGFTAGGQFFVVAAADTESALRQEERLGERLAALRDAGVLGEWRSPARFVPSAQRQADNARLVGERLGGDAVRALSAAIGLPMAVPAAAPALTLDRVIATAGVPALPGLVLDKGVHLVALDHVADAARLRAAADGLAGVTFVDPVADMGTLLGTYRQRAVLLLAVSLVLMLPPLMWRYGVRGGLCTMVPPLAALALTPPLLALFGLPFTFFAAMALVLVASAGVDYAVFCAESGADRDPVTIVATLLATVTTVLSFGLLAFSEVSGIRSFGAVMLVGIVLSALFAPLAGRVRPRRA